MSGPADGTYEQRALRIEDLTHLAQLEQATQLDPWSHEQVLAIAPLLQSGEYSGTLLCRDGTPVAYVLARCFLDECEILSVGVAPEVQGQGLGQQLMQAFLAQLPESTQKVHLEVRVSNIAAQKLYARQGFVEVGRRKGYYAVTHVDGSSGREDALLMTHDVKAMRKQ